MSDLSRLVPGGSHTYSKGDHNFTPNTPKQFARAKGGLTWSADGREFVDWGMGINNVLIGHAEDAIDDAAVAALRNGQAFSRPSVLEEQAAEAVLHRWPTADMIKFCKNGSDAVNAAVRLARAVTGRQHFAFDGTAPFHSTADWFCHRLPKNAGTLQAERAFALTFAHNDVRSLTQVFDTAPLACLILEPARFQRPRREFIDAVHDLCRRHGTLLVIDAIVYGYRYEVGGFCGFEPDLFTLGKGIANGYALGALLGKREYMARGAVDRDVFLLSTTNGAEQSALAAAIATADLYCVEPVTERLWHVGAFLRDAVNMEAERTGIDGLYVDSDFGCRPRLFIPDGLKAAFHSTLIDHGVLWPYPWACPCYRRTDDELWRTQAAIRAACERLAERAA